jgi:dTDP-4-dehydrorhamnose 3,5-epimerase/reductase
MDESRIVIVGANGQLGKALRSKYPKATALTRQDLDISNSRMVEEYDWSTADVVINAAVYANVDNAETDEGRLQAWQVNATGVGNLSRAAIIHQFLLIHVSSDYVFDGTRSPHTEDEPFTPLGVDAQSKTAGDIAVSVVPKHYILRTSWVIGDGKNFVRSIYGLGLKKISPNVVADQFGRLTFTTELVRGIDHLLSSQAAYGTYNLSNGGDVVSWADIARQIYEFAGFTKQGLTVGDITAKKYFAGKVSSPRPVQSALDMDKITATGFDPHDWREDLQKYIQAGQAKPKE